MLTQIVIPVLLLLWLSVFPASGRVSFLLQSLGITMIFLGLTYAALWAMPPYWVPYLYLLLLAGIVCRHLVSGQVDYKAVWAVGVVQTVAICITSLLGVLGAFLFVGAIKGRTLPDVEVVDVASPFPAGTYLVAHGGSNADINGHIETLDPQQPRFLPWRGQSRALDLFRINRAGFHVSGWLPGDPARYETFGTPLLAPCAGIVALAEDGVPDNTVPTMNREHMAGNFVALHCGNQRYVILAHFRNGSIAVKAGQQLEAGDYLGEAGNSGNSSQPHLHIHAQLGLPAENPLGGEPLGLTINGRFLVRNDRLRVP